MRSGGGNGAKAFGATASTGSDAGIGGADEPIGSDIGGGGTLGTIGRGCSPSRTATGVAAAGVGGIDTIAGGLDAKPGGCESRSAIGAARASSLNRGAGICKKSCGPGAWDIMPGGIVTGSTIGIGRWAASGEIGVLKIWSTRAELSASHTKSMARPAGPPLSAPSRTQDTVPRPDSAASPLANSSSTLTCVPGSSGFEVLMKTPVLLRFVLNVRATPSMSFALSRTLSRLTVAMRSPVRVCVGSKAGASSRPGGFFESDRAGQVAPLQHQSTPRHR